jgi:hypothetical protein
MGKTGDLSDFEHGMIADTGTGTRQAASWAFLCMTVSRVYREWCEKTKNIQSAAVLWPKTAC